MRHYLDCKFYPCYQSFIDDKRLNRFDHVMLGYLCAATTYGKRVIKLNRVKLMMELRLIDRTRVWRSLAKLHATGYINYSRTGEISMVTKWSHQKRHINLYSKLIRHPKLIWLDAEVFGVLAFQDSPRWKPKIDYQALAKTLGVSRIAVGQSIARLKKANFLVTNEKHQVFLTKHL